MGFAHAYTYAHLQIGCSSLDELIDKTIPSSIRFADEKLIEEEGKSEREALAEIGQYAEENKVSAAKVPVLTYLIRDCSARFHIQGVCFLSRHGLPRHRHPERHPAQCGGKSRVSLSTHMHPHINFYANAS